MYFTKIVQLEEIRSLGELVRKYDRLVFWHLRAYESLIGRQILESIHVRAEGLQMPFVRLDSAACSVETLRIAYAPFGKIFPQEWSDRPGFFGIETKHLKDPGPEFVPCQSSFISDVEEAPESWAKLTAHEYSLLEAFDAIYRWSLKGEGGSTPGPKRANLMNFLEWLIRKIWAFTA